MERVLVCIVMSACALSRAAASPPAASLANRIAGLAGDDDEKLSAFLRAYPAGFPYDELMELWVTEADPMQAQVEALIIQAGSAAVPAIIGKLDRLDTNRKVFAIDRLATAPGRHRAKAVAALAGLLTERTELPEAAIIGPTPEEKSPRRRLCDEAYLGLRRLLGKESAMERVMIARAFLARTFDERDAEISRWRARGRFSTPSPTKPRRPSRSDDSLMVPMR